jgi:hypothetical protein
LFRLDRIRRSLKIFLSLDLSKRSNLGQGRRNLKIKNLN